jgi:hypothetical protein
MGTDDKLVTVKWDSGITGTCYERRLTKIVPTFEVGDRCELVNDKDPRNGQLVTIIGTSTMRDHLAVRFDSGREQSALSKGYLRKINKEQEEHLTLKDSHKKLMEAVRESVKATMRAWVAADQLGNADLSESLWKAHMDAIRAYQSAERLGDGFPS